MLETDKHAYAISEMSVTASVSRILNIATNLKKNRYWEFVLIC